MIDKPSDGERFYDTLRAECIGGMERIWSVRGKAYQRSIERAAAEFSRPYRERIAGLEANNKLLRDKLFSLVAAHKVELTPAELRAAAAKLRHDAAVLQNTRAPSMFAADLHSDMISQAEDYEREATAKDLSEQREPSNHVHELGSCSRCDKPKACPDCGAAEPAYHQIGCRMTQPCTCSAASEYDDPCPRHGVLGIGVTGRD